MKGKKIGGYVITSQLGAGGMGHVFEGLRDVRELMEERKKDASGIIRRLTNGKKIEEQTVDQALESLAAQINTKLTEFDVPSERAEFYRTVLNRISPELSLDECRRAIKIMKPMKDSSKDEMRSSERFRVETEAQSRVNHPNVARVFNGGETTVTIGSAKLPIQYLIMEHVEVGKNLAKGRFDDLQEAVRVAYESLKGVEAIHASGFLHRDIKPRNILYGKDKAVKITDFGLVKAINKESSLALSLTADDSFVGTPEYLAPEVARGEDATQLTDVYSLGAVLYHLATGMPPIRNPGEKDGRKVAFEIAQKTETAPWVRTRRDEISPELERLIMKMLAKNPQERLTIQEAKEEMETITSKGLYVYEQPTVDSEIKRRTDIETLKGELRKWRSDHKTLASLYEQTAWLYTADTHEEINARIDAFEQAIQHYQQMPGVRANREKILRLKKEIAFEDRRIAELNKSLPKGKQIARIAKKPKNPKKTAMLATGVLAGLAIAGVVGSVLYDSHSRNQQQTQRTERFNANVAEIERALEKRDYNRATMEIKKAEEEAKLLPGTFAMKIRELTSRVENSQTYDKASASYAKAKESIALKDFAAARKSTEQAATLEAKLSDAQLKKKLDWAKLELGESAYAAVEDLLQKEEPRGATTGLGIISWLLDRTTSPELKERSEAIRAKVKAAESRMSQYAPQIKLFEEQIQALEKLTSDYTRISEQLKQDKFPKREEIDQLDKTLDSIFAKLTGINQNAVGREEYNRQSSELISARNKAQTLKGEYDVQLIKFLADQSQKIAQFLTIEDYTQADVPEKLRTAFEIIRDAKAQYENARPVNGFSALEQKLNKQSEQLQTLQEKTLVYTALTRQAAQGTPLEKATANSGLLKIYIEFGRLSEAEKCLNEIPNKTGLEMYATILELEKRLSKPQAAPPENNDEMTSGYVSLVAAYKKDSKLADHLKLYVALIGEKTGANMQTVQLGLSDLRDLESQVAELKQKTQTPAVKKQLEEQNKLLEDKRKAVYALLDSYAKPTGTQQETINQLQNAYRTAGYEKRAAELPQRFK
jgi:serine/threonine protein kinase